jgi:hypothetical protein
MSLPNPGQALADMTYFSVGRRPIINANVDNLCNERATCIATGRYVRSMRIEQRQSKLPGAHITLLTCSSCTSPKRYSCTWPGCNFTALQKHNLATHVCSRQCVFVSDSLVTILTSRRSTLERRSVCKDCGATFTTPPQLTQHRKDHTGRVKGVPMDVPCIASPPCAVELEVADCLLLLAAGT